jgi:paraquat-inducible protein B
MQWRKAMNDRNSERATPADMPEAVVQTKKSFSIVWVVPIVAMVIGGWLVYKALSEKGPTITITFDSAEGLEAGKTKLKYKDVEVGQVESIRLAKDLGQVEVTAELVKGAEDWLSENTRFWIVRARVAAGQVSGLGTLFSGVYIGIDPGKRGKTARTFKGLEIPPIVTADLPGRHFLLRAQKLGSLHIGSPIYYRQIKVGQVVAHNLEKDGQSVTIKTFIHAPHHEWVRKNTRFWNASGFDVSVDASGIKLNTESLVTIMTGGIAFDTPVSAKPSALADEGDTFILYESREKSFERIYETKTHWIVYFKSSVRGLNVGAPVEFKGIRIGKVTNIDLEFDWENLAFRVPVIVEIEPERLTMVGEQEMERTTAMEILVEKGLRAQLKQGSLLTGQLFVDIDIHPDAPPEKIIYGGRHIVFPTVPTPLEEITGDVTRIVDKLEKLPLKQIGDDLRDTMQHVSKTTERLEKLVKNLNTELAPAVKATLEKTQRTLSKVDRLFDAKSPMGYEMKRALTELGEAARSLRSFSEYLERHPEALIKGKGTKQ